MVQSVWHRIQTPEKEVKIASPEKLVVIELTRIFNQLCYNTGELPVTIADNPEQKLYYSLQEDRTRGGTCKVCTTSTKPKDYQVLSKYHFENKYFAVVFNPGDTKPKLVALVKKPRKAMQAQQLKETVKQLFERDFDIDARILAKIMTPQIYLGIPPEMELTNDHTWFILTKKQPTASVPAQEIKPHLLPTVVAPPPTIATQKKLVSELS